MAALTANPHNALPPSWDESIVPTLRKRLEKESRILSKRLSTISITDEGPPSESSQTAQRAVSPPQNTVGSSTALSSSAGIYPYRPSAIPRPNYSRAERSAASPSPPPLPPHIVDPARKAVSKRQRTQSTPFPFIPPPSGSPGSNGVVTPTPSTSSSVSPRIQSPPLGRITPTPSRIPTVSSRMRSGSQSSQGIGSLNGAKASLPPSHKFSPSETTSIDSDYLPHSLHAKVSSSSLARQRIVDELPPFANDRLQHPSETENTGRLSSDEERPFQHWYRGDVSRNGGVGEYRVGKRMEMLDIANYGHALRAPASRSRPHEEPPLHSPDLPIIPRKRAESVSSRERASLYMEPHEDVITGRVLDETPLTDLEGEETDYEHEYRRFSDDLAPEPEVQQNHSEHPPSHSDHTPSNHRPPPESTPPPSTRISPIKSQDRLPRSQPPPPQSQSQSNTPKQSTAPSSAASQPPTPPKQGNEGRGRAPSASRTKLPSKPKTQKRSKSAADALRKHNASELLDYAGLADAVPDIRTPLPRNGNWDEVILPTVARRMGIEYEKEDPAELARRKVRESRVPPAPGTFGYDHSKYKPPRKDDEIPMDEFGQRDPARLPEADQDQRIHNPEIAPVVDEPKPTLRPLRSRRETMPSPAPFSHYSTSPEDASTTNTSRRKERQDVPQILVHPPTLDAGNKSSVYVEEGHDSGCCKCIVM